MSAIGNASAVQVNFHCSVIRAANTLKFGSRRQTQLYLNAITKRLSLGSGPSGILFPVEVQVLSWALCNRNKLEPFGIHWNFEGFFLLTLPSDPHFQRVPWLTGNGSASTNTLSMAACHSKCSSSRSSRPAVQWLSATRRVKNKARLQQRIDRILEDA